MTESQPMIAVVDDDEDIRKSLRRLLRSAGFDATTYASAEEYHLCMSESAAVCLIFDVRLPGQSGVELYQRLIREQHPRPTIFISAHDNDLASARSAAADAVAFLRKPFDDVELLNAVHKALGNANTV
jgi:FixJ family two-component response regulator